MTNSPPSVISSAPSPKFIIGNGAIVNDGKHSYWKTFTENGNVVLIPIFIIKEKTK